MLRKGAGHNSQKRSCVICKKATNSYLMFEETIGVVVPIHLDCVRDELSESDQDAILESIREIKKVIRRSIGGE